MNAFFIDTSLLILVTITFSFINMKCLYQSNIFPFYVDYYLLVTGSDYIWTPKLMLFNICLV